MTSPTPNQITARRANCSWESPTLAAKRKAGIATSHHRKWMPARFMAGESLEAIAAHYRVPVSQVAARIGEYADREFARFLK